MCNGIGMVAVFFLMHVQHSLSNSALVSGSCALALTVGGHVSLSYGKREIKDVGKNAFICDLQDSLKQVKQILLSISKGLFRGRRSQQETETEIARCKSACIMTMSSQI